MPQKQEKREIMEVQGKEEVSRNNTFFSLNLYKLLSRCLWKRPSDLRHCVWDSFGVIVRDDHCVLEQFLIFLLMSEVGTNLNQNMQGATKHQTVSFQICQHFINYNCEHNSFQTINSI